MIEDNFAFIANYLWRESIKNLNSYLTEEELGSFSSNDYYYLTTIHYMGKPNFSQVADALNLTKPAISAIIRKLVKLNLIEKVQSEEDKRMYYLGITPKGKTIIAGDHELYKNFDLLIRELATSDEHYEFVGNLLQEIVNNLGKG